MKRLIVFILLSILLCGVNIPFAKDLTIDKIFPSSNMEVYIIEKSNLSFDKIDNGMGEIIFCETKDLDYILHNCSKVAGFTIKIQNMEINDIIKSLNVTNTFALNFGVYGWSKIFENLNEINNKSIEISRKMVNFQCVAREDYVLVGMPIILGSF